MEGCAVFGNVSVGCASLWQFHISFKVNVVPFVAGLFCSDGNVLFISDVFSNAIVVYISYVHGDVIS